MYRADKMRIFEEPLSDNCPPETTLDLLTRDIGVGQDTDALGPVRPFSGKDGELGDNERGLAAAGTCRNIDGRPMLQIRAPGFIECVEPHNRTDPVNVIVGYLGYQGICIRHYLPRRSRLSNLMSGDWDFR